MFSVSWTFDEHAVPSLERSKLEWSCWWAPCFSLLHTCIRSGHLHMPALVSPNQCAGSASAQPHPPSYPGSRKRYYASSKFGQVTCESIWSLHNNAYESLGMSSMSPYDILWLPIWDAGSIVGQLGSVPFELRSADLPRASPGNAGWNESILTESRIVTLDLVSSFKLKIDLYSSPMRTLRDRERARKLRVLTTCPGREALNFPTELGFHSMAV